MQRKRAAGLPRAELPTGTGKTIRRREPDGDQLACLPMPPVVVHRPTGAGVAVRTDGALGVPVDRELVPLEASLLLRLPAVIGSRRPHDVDAEAGLARREPVGIEVATVHQMGLRQQVTAG